MIKESEITYKEVHRLTMVDSYGEVVDNTEVVGAVWGALMPFAYREAKEDLLNSRRATAKQLEGLNKIKSKEEFKVLVDEHFGGFMFSEYNEILNIFIDEKGIFDGAFAFRFLYLSTFMDYNNYLRWGISFRGKDRDYMVESDLKEVMGLSKPHLIKFKKKLIELNIISIKKDKRITINKKYCCKGRLKETENRNYIRVFEKGIQDLYINATPKEHKLLGIFINLMPYLNIQHNILCFNPEENHPFKVEPLRIQDICIISGQSLKNARRLENNLLKITLGGQPLIMKHSKFRAVLYSVNPKLFYKGNNIKSLQALINLFDIK